MFRVSLIFCVALIFGVTAKPHKPWNKLTEEAFQDVVMSMNDKGKMSWGVEVEPPEDMDETDYDIDPNMKIWKSMMASGQDKQSLKAVEDLLKAQMQNLGALPAAIVQAEPSQEQPEDDTDDINFSEPEQDWDEVYHKERKELDGYLAPLLAEYKAGAKVRVAYSEPEKDEDELYHRDVQSSPVQMEPLRREVRVENEVRVHLQPEEDLDDLYHRDVLQPSPYQGDAEAAAPVDVPSQKKYSQPEEDLDHLYHQ